MANTDIRFGLRYVSGPIQLVRFNLTASYGVALFQGDCIAVVTAGTVQRHTPGSGISGVVWGFIRSDDMPVSNITATDTAYTYKIIANVCPETLYWCQEDGDTTPLALTDIGNNVNLVYTHAGSTTTGISGMEIDSSSKATTTTLDVHLIRLANEYIEPDGNITAFDSTSGLAKFLVKIHNFVSGNLGTGI